MPSHYNSQCELFQLHIDSLLDGDLEPSREGELRAHLARCGACRAELAYAEALHRAVVELPLLDCSDQALEPVSRLFAESRVNPKPDPGSFWSALGGLAWSASAPVRFGIPVAAVVLLLVGLGLFPGTREPVPELAELSAREPSVQAQAAYSEAEVRQAMQDLDLAIDYLARISALTGAMIEDRFLLRQVEESINASFRNERPAAARRGSSGPI